MSVAALVLGIVGLVFSVIPCTWWVGLIIGIVGLILGIIALAKCAKAGLPKGQALAGVICSGIAVAYPILLVLVFAAAFATA